MPHLWQRWARLAAAMPSRRWRHHPLVPARTASRPSGQGSEVAGHAKERTFHCRVFAGHSGRRTGAITPMSPAVDEALRPAMSKARDAARLASLEPDHPLVPQSAQELALVLTPSRGCLLSRAARPASVVRRRR